MSIQGEHGGYQNRLMLDLSSDQYILIGGIEGINPHSLDYFKNFITSPSTAWVRQRTSAGVLAFRASSFKFSNNIEVQLLEDSSIIQSLSEVERQLHTRFPPFIIAALLGALLAAHEGFRNGYNSLAGAPSFWALTSSNNTGAKITYWDDVTHAHNIELCIDNIIEFKSVLKPDAGPLDISRFMIGLGESLWDPDVRKKMAQIHLDEETRKFLSSLASSRLSLQPKRRVKVAGVTFTIDERTHKDKVWSQVMEWDSGHIRKKILQYLTGYKHGYSFCPSDFTKKMSEISSNINPRAAAAISDQLLIDAICNGVRETYGSFRVDLPEFLSLFSIGVHSLRIWLISGEGLWVALEQDNQPRISFFWRTKPPHIMRWVLPELLIPLIHTTIAALWRDHRVGGKEVFRQQEAPSKYKDQSSNRKIVFRGKLKWGSDHDLERILRQAYDVHGHIRKLPPGKRASSRAKKLASKQGIKIRRGYTYVRNHKRGNPDRDVQKVTVRAQGLASLVIAQQRTAT
ncbi:MAG: hypothetical protein P8Z41_04930 [Anaerolineales bacterium]